MPGAAQGGASYGAAGRRAAGTPPKGSSAGVYLGVGFDPSNTGPGVAVDPYTPNIARGTGNIYSISRSIKQVSTGMYAEFQTSAGSNCGVGICNASQSLASSYGNGTGVGYYSNGNIYSQGSSSSQSAYGFGDVIGIAVGSGRVYFSLNGTWQNGAPSTGSSGGFVAPSGVLYLAALFSNSQFAEVYTVPQLMKYGPPAGYSAMG